MAKYTYPRVTTSVTALNHSSVQPAQEDTTNLFVPIVTERGPVGLTVVHSLAEFIETFGNLSYENQGQVALNLMNWLSNGGTAYVYRLSDISGKYSGNSSYVLPTDEKENVITDSSITVTAKYPGKSYANYSVEFTPGTIDNGSIQSFREIFVKNPDNVIVERFYRVKKNEVESIYGMSDYIGEINISTVLPNASSFSVKFDTIRDITEGNYNNYNDKKIISDFWSGNIFFDSESGSVLYSNDSSTCKACRDILYNKLETPIDVILDPGYNASTAKAMYDFLGNYSGTRKDIFTYYTTGVADYNESSSKYTGKVTFESLKETNIGKTTYNLSEEINHALYTHKMVISEETITECSKDIEVVPTYFLSSLIPYNDKAYGIQYPTAGQRRGVLEGVKKINENPLPESKEKYFKDRVNYVEKDTRGYYFMSQRTHDTSTEEGYTALSFINNVRVKNKMVKDIERLGREYLFEFNDSITLSQLSSVLNKYVNNWVANRTLEKGSVIVSKNPWSDEAVDIQLNIKFNGTIEVISVDITIE